MSCHVMWCGVMSFDVMRFLVLCYVTWCNVMSCDVFSCDERHLLWSDAVQWDAISWVCDEMWLVAMSRCWFEVVVWCGELEDELVIRTTKYCKYYTVLEGTVLQSTTPYSKILQRTAKQYYSSTRTTKYYSSSTTKYYSGTTKYYSVLQSSTPVQYHKVLLQYYKVLLRYYKVLLRTTEDYKVRHSTTKYYSVLQGTTSRLIVQHMKRPVQCAKQQETPSDFTKYCACHEKWFWWLILVSYETSSTMRGATGVTLQPHQIVCLPRKMTLMIDVRHIWNVIYNARSNKTHPPTSPNTAPATQNCNPKSKRNLPKTVEASFTMADDSSMIRTWSEHEMARLNPPVRRGYFSPLGNAFCNENCNISRSGYLSEFHQPHQILNDSHDWCPSRMKRHWQCAEQQDSSSNVTKYCAYTTKNYSHDWCPSHMKRYWQCAEQQDSSSNVTKYCACHAKKTLMIDVRHIWNVIDNAQSSRTHSPTSPNTAPATQNDTHDWCPSNMKRYLQCVDQQV